MIKTKRMLFLTAMGGAMLATALAAPAASDGLPPHAHLHLNGIIEDENGASIKGCRALAGGRPVPDHAHHAHLHQGRPGEALEAAGNGIAPVFFGEEGTPWQNCEELIEYWGLTVRKGR